MHCFREFQDHIGNLILLPMGPTLPWWDALDLEKINAHLRATAQRLADAGCDFFVCPDNTAHIALDMARGPYPLPGLHICDVVAERAKADGRTCIALLGTRYTMQGPAYPAAFARHGLVMRTPNAGDQELMNKLIFDELCMGEITEPARAQFVRLIEELKAEGCDAVALSCTEIPLIVTPEISPLPTLDSTRLLAHAAVDVALGRRPLPSWRGAGLDRTAAPSPARRWARPASVMSYIKWRCRRGRRRSKKEALRLL